MNWKAKTPNPEILRESAAAVAFPLEFDDTVSGILDQLKRAVPYDSASVQLLIGNELEIIGERGFPEEKNSIGMRFVLDENNPAYPILRDGLPYILYPNIQLINERFKGFFHDHISGWMAIPLYARGRLIGMFTMGGFTVNKFTEVHARFASIFANFNLQGNCDFRIFIPGDLAYQSYADGVANLSYQYLSPQDLINNLR